MIVKRFYDTMLAQTSYLIGCGRSGTAIVIDANRDVTQYMKMASEEGVRITHITETHIHADFVSGSRELASRTGATMFLSGEGGKDWQYAFAASDGAVLIHGGDTLHVGNVEIEVVHTPGHTPEHLSFLITDTAAADEPIAIVTGDFVFVGDVGRPDLLERAAGESGTMEAAARRLYASLQQFAMYPDWLQIWPGHGAGSACGKGLSAVPHSTVGYEKRFNWAFGVHDENEFLQNVLSGQPEPPKYFAQMKRINRDGPPILGRVERPARLNRAALEDVIESGAFVLDTRSAASFAHGHAAGTVNVPLAGSFTTWAGWLTPYDRAFYLIVEEGCDDCLDDAMRDLSMIGLDRVAGYTDGSAIREEEKAGDTVSTLEISPAGLADRLARGAVHVIDVRGRAEWDSGHIAGARNIPVGYLADRLSELPTGSPLVLQCQAGARSAIAASILQAHGVSDVLNLTGGIAAWENAGYPVQRDTSSTVEA